MRNAASSKPTFEQWRVLALLVISIGINYIDRGSLSMAAPALSKELALSPAQLGLLFSAFFWSYAGFMVVAGWLTDRYNVGLVLGLGYLLWTLATFWTGLVTSLSALLAARILLGLGESVAFPTVSRIVATGFAINQRGVPNAMVDAGLKVGPALGMLVGGLVISHYGWRFLFLALGLGGMLWLIPWALWAPRGGGASGDRHSLETGPGILQILRKRDAWGTFVGNFCCNYSYYFLLTWLPSYLVTERHLSMSRMAVLGSLPLWGSAITSLGGGWLSDRLITRGVSPTVARKSFVVTGLLMSALVLPAGMVSDLKACIGLLILAYIAFGLFSSNHWAITQTLAGPLAAGRWTGLQNAISNLGGIIAPFVTGLIISRTGSYFMAFLLAAVVVVIGAAFYLFVVGEVAPVSWAATERAAAGVNG
jgi:MFS transporter, ACS family, D-galactonate transporter